MDAILTQKCRRAPDLPVLFTRYSRQGQRLVKSLATSVNDMFGVYTEDGKPIHRPSDFRVYYPFRPSGTAGAVVLLADPEAFSLRRVFPQSPTTPVTFRYWRPLPCPRPERWNTLGTATRLVVDVWIPATNPARTSLTSDRLQQVTTGFPEAIIRTSRDGLTFASPNFGLVLAGASPEARTRSAPPALPLGRRTLRRARCRGKCSHRTVHCRAPQCHCRRDVGIIQSSSR